MSKKTKRRRSGMVMKLRSNKAGKSLYPTQETTGIGSPETTAGEAGAAGRTAK